MKKFRKLIALALLAALLTTSTEDLSAQDFYYAGGNGYQEYRQAPSLAPAIALGAIAIVAIIAVAVQNSNNDHSHSHTSGT